jgi:hypothetical protein
MLSPCSTLIIRHWPKLPSKEVNTKNERMELYRNIYSQVELEIFKAVGGVSMLEVRELQKKITERLGLKTLRIDRRTKKGVILWFCEHWDQISPVIHNYNTTDRTALRGDEISLTKNYKDSKNENPFAFLSFVEDDDYADADMFNEFWSDSF